MAIKTHDASSTRKPSPAAGGGTRPPRPKANPLSGLAHAALALWGVITIFPLIWTFLSSFKTNTEIFGNSWSLPAELRTESWGRAWETAQVGKYMLNTVIVVSAGTLLTMLFGSMAAYVLARYTFPGSKIVYVVFVSGLAFPVFLAMMPLFFVVEDLGLLNSHIGLVLVYVAYSMPFTVLFMTAFFRNLPTSVGEAAMIDGASHTRTFFQIMLPMAKPGVVSITIFNVLGQWNQYLLPLVLLAEDRDKWVITQGIADISVIAGYEADWPGLFAALSMAIIPMLIVYVVFQRQIQSGLTSGAVK
ncbi:N-acetylglucosamine transport system permease protein [Sinosporangium album]|uniref:N-acetylglucosamine transport system permease protein n=1 Tax=Sinosporangium album TaxID=504805 RepID=A0A1G8C5N4_9ACTN|nr:carbohydrate ABC transporter permease [Sinosporangium album]SDH40230.1 N-acetylglucosamine transport system permease protein [Sinosporangium album]